VTDVPVHPLPTRRRGIGGRRRPSTLAAGAIAASTAKAAPEPSLRPDEGRGQRASRAYVSAVHPTAPRRIEKEELNDGDPATARRRRVLTLKRGSRHWKGGGPRKLGTMKTVTRTQAAAVVLGARRVEKNTLRGFFDLRLPSGLVLRGCSLHLSHGRWWVGMPSQSYTNRDGAQAWSPIVDFTDARSRKRFQEVALAALVAHGLFPEIAESAEAQPS
jgi:hypothetical protein